MVPTYVMNSDESVRLWLEKLQQGDEDAARAVWDQFFPKLVRLARQRAPAATRRVEDEQDIALSALDSFFRAVQDRRFDQLKDVNDLWRVLSEITRRKAVDRVRRYRALKRGAGRVRGDSAFARNAQGRHSLPGGFDETPDQSIGPEMAVMLTEEIRTLFENLQDKSLQELALARLEGHTHPQLAERFDCSLSTIERRMRLIRQVWRQGNTHEQ